MKACWLNKDNNKKIIVFFAGWSFDENPFKFLDCTDFDVLFVYDYNDFDIPQEFSEFEKYSEKYLLAWSMGVYVGGKLRKIFNDFDYKIAINGTLSPVDNQYGIPVRAFELTLKHAVAGLEGKFYKNVFQTDDELNRYFETPVQRSIENRVSELENLYNDIKSTQESNNEFYDCAIVSEFDKIIPPNNQKNSHEKFGVLVKSLQTGHSPFYNFNRWDEIIKLCR